MPSSTDPYRIFPPATAQERADLRASIEAVGLRNPVVIDEYANVIDGHERRDICIELGLDWMAGSDVRVGLSDAEKKALAVEYNLWRRPIRLSRAKRRELVEVYLVARPDVSETIVAQMFGVSQPTVNRYKKRLIQSNKLQQPEATIGKDGVKRKVGKRDGARLIIKSRKEFESLKADIPEVADDLSGIIRRPKKINSEARRKRALKAVEESSVKRSPANFSIRHNDFRNMRIKPESVDVIITDPPWDIEYEEEWTAFAEKAWYWLRPSGLLVSYMGLMYLPQFLKAMMQCLHWRWMINLEFSASKRTWSSGIVETWRPICIFQNGGNRRKLDIRDTIQSPGRSKDYHDWQQSVPVARYLVERLTNPGDVVCDPFLGTGTTAVAVAQLGEGRRFVGCDIKERQVKTARHRVKMEGKEAA